MLSLRKKTFELLLGFATGIAWAFSFASAVFSFLYFYQYGFFAACAIAIVSFAIMLIPVFIFEAIFILNDIHSNNAKQTQILEEISKKLEQKCLDT